MTRLVGDIGGTNARFALVHAGSTSPTAVGTLACADYPSLAPAIRAYLNSAGITSISEAVIAVATPVHGDAIRLTNNNWVFSQSAIQQSFNLKRLAFINDFAALALAVPRLPKNELYSVGGGTSRERYPLAVLGPGTGLGVSGLISAPDGLWIPIQGEGGHVTIAPRTQREFDIVQWLSAKFGHVSAERFLSGPGLCLLHEAIQTLDGKAPVILTSAEITRAAINNTAPACVEAMAIFFSQLGSCAADLALTLGAEGGVYIGGGIAPRLVQALEKSSFRESFESKGRMSKYLSRISTRIIMQKYPALIGAAGLLSG